MATKFGNAGMGNRSCLSFPHSAFSWLRGFSVSLRQGARGMARMVRWSVVAALVVVIVVAPIVFFRFVYDTHKRLRVVDPGRVYRSGQMTADGFADAVERFHLRTIINVQDEFPDPDIELSFWSRRTIKESELCRQLGVRYVHLMPTLLPRRL